MPAFCERCLAARKRWMQTRNRSLGTENLAHVRRGSIASFWPCADHFRSTPINRHARSRPACLKGARFGPLHGSKQLKLFDHFVGAGEQKMRDCDLAEFARVKIVNFPKAICA